VLRREYETLRHEKYLPETITESIKDGFIEIALAHLPSPVTPASGPENA